MNSKKIAIIGAVVLVIIGCVIAAGCTATQQSNTGTTGSTSDLVNQIAGAWQCKYVDGGTEYIGVSILNTDGTSYWYSSSKDSKITDTLLYNQRWEITGNNAFTIYNLDTGTTYQYKYNPATDTIMEIGEDSVGEFKRMDPITGTWFSEGIDDITGKKAKFSTTFLNIGTGYLYMEFEDGTTLAEELTWKKNPNGTYEVVYSDGDKLTWTLNNNGATVSTDTENISVEKKISDSYYYLPMLGPWHNEKTSTITNFNADGTGTIYKEPSVIGTFTWTPENIVKYKVHYLTGGFAGRDAVWTYDKEKNVFIGDDGLFSVVRPTESVAGVTIVKFSTEPIVGQWTTKYPREGNIVADAILTVLGNGEAYWLALADVDGIQLSTLSKDTWVKTKENTYTGTSKSGNKYTWVYNPKKDTLTENNTYVYTRLEPVVGIWSGSSSENTGNGTATTIMKPDGTGMVTVAKDDGTVSVYQLTWKINADGEYEVDFGDGEEKIYTVDVEGKILTTEDGRTKTKEFLDSSFLMSITGAWYNKEFDSLTVFNADGTGFLNYQNSVKLFNWKPKDDGKIELTYTEGIGSDGKSVKGKVSEWTYDRENNVFTNSHGNKYIRPTESIKDKITVN